MLGRELGRAGLVVVSGLARGVDGEAHRGALEAGGATVAVLGCGIDRDYPAAHRELAARIRATGLTVSEYAPGVEPAPWRFPARNRIIAGLSAATVVVEARDRSGALITADLALEEGREVFAVPGEITSALSSGTNDLLKLGATPLTAAADVLDVFGLAQRRRQSRSSSAPRPKRCSLGCATARRAPTSSRVRPGSMRARSRLRSPSSSSPAARSREEVCTGRTSIATYGRVVLAGRAGGTARARVARRAPRRRRDRRRRHGLLVCAHARRGRAARAPVRGAARRLGRERSERRLRAARARDLVPGGAGTVRQRGAAELWRFTERTLDRMERLAGDALRRVGSLRLADDEELDAIRAEYEALREDGIAAEWVDELPAPLDATFRGAILHPGDGSLQPARWVRRLAARAVEAGAEIVEETRVESLDDVDAEQVVIATDGYTSGLLPELDRTIKPVRGQVIVTEPLAETLYPRPHYARHGFDYWQQTPDRRLVLGGRRDKNLDAEFTNEEAITEPIQAELERFAAELAGGEPRIEHRWPGIFGSTEDSPPARGPRFRAATESGSQPATRATATSWASPAASSWRRRSSVRLRQSSSTSILRG